MKGHAFGRRLGHAWRGLATAFRREKSFRTHVGALLLLVVAMALLRATPVWWALLLVSASLVLVAELFNTAIEMLADHLHPGVHPAIGQAKDVAAAAVLVASCLAVAVGVAWIVSLAV